MELLAGPIFVLLGDIFGCANHQSLLAAKLSDVICIGRCFRPVLIEVPHFASLRGSEREITILRSDNGQTWREHSIPATEEAVQDALEGSFTGR